MFDFEKLKGGGGDRFLGGFFLSPFWVMQCAGSVCREKGEDRGSRMAVEKSQPCLTHLLVAALTRKTLVR